MTKAVNNHRINTGRAVVKHHAQSPNNIKIHKRSRQTNNSSDEVGSESHSYLKDRLKRRSPSPAARASVPVDDDEHVTETDEQIRRLQQALNQLNTPNFEKQSHNEDLVKDADQFSLTLIDEDM